MKPIYITIICTISLIALIFGTLASVYNTAVGYDETIQNAASSIQVQQKRTHDLILQLVQVAEQAANKEATTQTEIAKLRTVASTGNIENTQIELKATAEAYPSLQFNQTYHQLMDELAISANLIAQYRITYNSNVQDYHQFVRRQPSSAILGWLGYHVIDYPYMEFTNTELPTNLFGQ